MIPPGGLRGESLGAQRQGTPLSASPVTSWNARLECMPRAELERYQLGKLGEQLAYVYERDNPHGWHLEWWHHVHGCRRVLKIVRHTVTHRIAAVGQPQDDLPVPPDEMR